jgi:glycine/D-amino acid oxidase-like deaminating enzyme
MARFESEVEECKEYVEAKKDRQEALGTTQELWDSETCKSTLFGDKWACGIHQGLAGQFWPRKAVLGIASIILKAGVSIRTHTTVTEVSRGSWSRDRSFTLSTSSGSSIIASKLIHATNGYASTLLPQLKGVLIPVRGQVIATSVVENFWIPKNLSMNDGYEYLIHRFGDKRIVYGGMRWKAETAGKEVAVCDDSTIDKFISEHLHSSLIELFPRLNDEKDFKVDYEWTGIMGYSCDNYPLIGQVGPSENEWIAAGYSGNGMPQCFGAARAVAGMIQGRAPTGANWIPMFDPRRFENEVYASKFRYTGAKLLKMDE